MLLMCFGNLHEDKKLKIQILYLNNLDIFMTYRSHMLKSIHRFFFVLLIMEGVDNRK